MINPQNVMDILGNLISERLAISSTSSNGPKDEEVAAILFKNIQSILNCSSYSLLVKKNKHVIILSFLNLWSVTLLSFQFPENVPSRN